MTLPAAEVGRLATRGVPRDTPALRSALESRVRAAEIRPRELAPAAVLVVRRADVDAPLSGAGWDHACRARLAELAARAARPENGVVAEGAEAVLFRDEAELLACLAADLARGAAGRRWWWRLLLGRFGSTPADLLAGQPEAAPAVLAELHAWDRAAAVLETFDADDVVTVLHALARAHDAPALAAVAVELAAAFAPGGFEPGAPGAPETGADERPEYPRLTRRETPAALTRAPAAAPDVTGARAPAPASGEGGVRLADARRLLLRTALRLHARPASARGEAFAGELRRSAPMLRRALDRSVPAASDSAATAPRTPSAPGHVDPVEPRPPRPLDPAAADTVAEAQTTASRDAPPAPPARTARSSPPPRADAAAWEDGVTTGLAGVFMLVNAIAWLDLPDDERVAAELGAWGVLEALARDLLGDPPPDAVWEVLALLAGREPGVALHSPYTRGWLTRSLPAVRARLAEALEVDGDAVAAELLIRWGTVHVTRTHVDVVLTLDAISLRVRRAGLDADPGWMPFYGRVIRLHFEDAL
ncbi:hypothetical protein OM076_38720 [Solirubrobacter ginsenosidimutans]|uniref:Uncharacterized protein n=1 Tax=Solirubrobacter ginsenosidimutans TaxID=490573 RepID=A0A9X3N395_9ACTN|nr:hypothetical protein [Solirubrobacter ginsenosidimutans]MDA0166263.1 hypothetical protein [Solirubrobacter ginsenosidimutans]